MSSKTDQSPNNPPKSGAIACYRYGWGVLKRYFLELLVIVILAGLAAIPAGLFTGESDMSAELDRESRQQLLSLRKELNENLQEMKGRDGFDTRSHQRNFERQMEQMERHLEEAFEGKELSERLHRENLKQQIDFFNKNQLDSSLEKLSESLESLKDKKPEFSDTSAPKSEELQRQQALRENTQQLVTKIDSIINQSAANTNSTAGSNSFYFTLGYLLLFLLPLQYGVDFTFLKAVRHEHPRVGDILSFFNNYLSVAIALILVHIFTAIGLFMLIIPGLFFMCKLAFVPYLATYERIGAFDSIRLSWRMTRGYAWTVFRIWLIGIPIYFLGILALGVGIIVSIMWVNLAYAALYFRAAEESEDLRLYRDRNEMHPFERTSKRENRESQQEKGLPNLLDRG